jgi:hypothetical protein
MKELEIACECSCRERKSPQRMLRACAIQVRLAAVLFGFYLCPLSFVNVWPARNAHVPRRPCRRRRRLIDRRRTRDRPSWCSSGRFRTATANGNQTRQSDTESFYSTASHAPIPCCLRAFRLQEGLLARRHFP